MKMLLEILLIIVIIFLAICLFFYFAPILTAPKVQENKFGSVCLGKNCFQVELAITEKERDLGLMYRKELDKNKGMLFIFDKEGIYPFWMKNTLISLDMIWIDANNEVVFIAQNVQPCKSLICPSVVPSAKAKYVLELNAGTSQQIGIAVGDQVAITK